MFRHVLIFLALLTTIVACRKEDYITPSPTGPVTQSETNNWILDSMRYFYLWNDYLPSTADTSLPTTEFFASLKYKDDRFSFLYEPNNFSTYPKNMLFTYGIDFSVISYPGAPEGVIGVIKLVIPGSVAALNGIKRGDYFSAINSTPLTASNAASLSAAMLAATTSSTLTMYHSGITITLPSQGLGENPIYLQDTFQVNGKVIAYLFYNYFNDTYNTALQQAFASFKTAGATELILDLRYNPGGSVAAASLLNAMIAPGIAESSIFAKYKGNNHLGSSSITFKSALSVPESGYAISFSSLSDKRLSLSRVFILSGSSTASAAELTINSLKPYTNVIQIGDTTYGKDKGAVIIADNRSPQRISWTLMPITYNLFNANGTGGYTTGINPDYPIDEMAAQPLTDIGDKNDPLIAKAIAIINGNGRMTDNSSGKIVRFYDSRSIVADKEIVKWPVNLTR